MIWTCSRSWMHSCVCLQESPMHKALFWVAVAVLQLDEVNLYSAGTALLEQNLHTLDTMRVFNDKVKQTRLAELEYDVWNKTDFRNQTVTWVWTARFVRRSRTCDSVSGPVLDVSCFCFFRECKVTVRGSLKQIHTNATNTTCIGCSDVPIYWYWY